MTSRNIPSGIASGPPRKASSRIALRRRRVAELGAQDAQRGQPARAPLARQLLGQRVELGEPARAAAHREHLGGPGALGVARLCALGEAPAVVGAALGQLDVARELGEDAAPAHGERLEQRLAQLGGQRLEPGVVVACGADLAGL